MNTVTDAEKFLFDIQSYLILRGAIDLDLVEALDRAVVENEALDHDESWADGIPVVRARHFIKDHNIQHQVRLNGLPRLDAIFDQLIAHPAILPYLKEFMGEPRCNTITSTDIARVPCGITTMPDITGCRHLFESDSLRNKGT